MFRNGFQVRLRRSYEAQRRTIQQQWNSRSLWLSFSIKMGLLKKWKGNSMLPSTIWTTIGPLITSRLCSPFKTSAATLQHSNYDTRHHQCHQLYKITIISVTAISLYNQLLLNMRATTRADPWAVKSSPGAPSSCQQKWFGQVFYFMITMQCNLKITL